MTLDEAIAKAEEEIDCIISNALDQTEGVLRKYGATPDEMVKTLTTYAAEFEGWKREEIAKLRIELQRGLRAMAHRCIERLAGLSPDSPDLHWRYSATGTADRLGSNVPVAASSKHRGGEDRCKIRDRFRTGGGVAKTRKQVLYSRERSKPFVKIF